jgi:hypothetical protein
MAQNKYAKIVEIPEIAFDWKTMSGEGMSLADVCQAHPGRTIRLRIIRKACSGPGYGLGDLHPAKPVAQWRVKSRLDGTHSRNKGGMRYYGSCEGCDFVIEFAVAEVK